jgi:hypothetical protein
MLESAGRHQPSLPPSALHDDPGFIVLQDDVYFLDREWIHCRGLHRGAG